MSLNYFFCWGIEPKGGGNLYYTTNNREVSFLGNIYKPTGAVPYTVIQKTLGLGTDNLEIAGAFTGDITFDDIRSGKFVDSRVTGYRVNANNLGEYTLEFKGRVGKFTYDDFHFKAEIRSLSSVVGNARARVYSRNCPYKLGDSSCGVNLGLHTTTSTVISVVGDLITISDSYPLDEYTFGTIKGPDNIVYNIRYASGNLIYLWDTPTIEATEVVTLTKGCNKIRQTCKSKFGNIQNFGGFDLIPTEDILTNIAIQGKDVYDGSSYFEPLS